MDQTINFEIKHDALAVIQTLNIDANFAEMEAYLTEMMRPYKGLKLTDMAAAKSARAYVNKVRKSIDDSRKLVKKLYQEPLTAFEAKVKHLTDICDEASGAIDAQIKAEEQKEKDARVAALRTYFESSCKDVADYITWERIYNPKWENKSYGIDKAQDEIDRAIDATQANIDAIQAMHSPYETSLLLVLKETGDIAKVLQKQAACEALEAHRKEREAEMNQPIPEQPAQRPATAQIAEEPVQTAVPVPPPQPNEKLYTFTLEFTATKEQAFMIDAFFKENHIRYRKIK